MGSLSLSRIVQSSAARSLFLMKIRAASLGVKFLLTLYIAKFMGFETLGGFGLVSAAAVTVPIFLSLAIMTSLSRKAITQTYEEITASLRYYLKFIALAYIVILAGSFVAGEITEFGVLLPTIVAVIFLEHLNNDFYTLFLNLSKPFAANMLQLIRTAGWMIPFMGASFLFPDFRTHETLLLSWVAGGLATLACYAWLMRGWPWKSDAPRTPLYKWIGLEFAVSKTIYATSCLSSAGQYVTQLLITFFLGLELNGVYVYFTQVTSAAANLMHTGLIQLARPKLVRAYQSADPAYADIYRKARKNVFFGSVGMSVVLAVALFAITLFLDRPLAMEWFPVFGLILLSFIMGLVGDVQGLVFYSQHRDGLTLKSYIFSLGVVIAFGAILMPFLSLWGAAIAIILSAASRLWVQSRCLKTILEPQKQ